MGFMMLTTAEVAARLGLVARTVENWRYAKKGPPFFYVGRSVRYSAEAVEEWLAAQQRGPAIVEITGIIRKPGTS